MRECPREQELFEALQASQWPHCCSEDLQRHVSACAACLDLVAVVTTLLDERRETMASAELPSSAIVWWRAQMRARQEAVRQASRPMTLVEWISFACAVGILAAAAGHARPFLTSWFSRLEGTAGALKVPQVGWPDLAQLSYPMLASLVFLTLLVIVAPAAAYLVVRDK